MMMMKSNNGHGSYGNSPRDPLLNQLNPQYHNHHHSFVSNGNLHLNGSSPLSSNQPLNVQRIASCSLSPSDGVVMVKLTDEMFAALENCQKSGKPMRIRIEEQGGTIEIGDGAASSMTNNTFRFQKQVLPYPTDAIVQTGNKIRNVGTYKTKYQIQATDKSFEETRKRAEKRAEVEKSRGTKDLPKATTASSNSSRYLSSHSSNSTPKSSTLSKVSPTSNSASTSSQKTPTPDNMMKSNLLSQPLRKRIAHLIVTQKYKSWEEIYAKLSSDGLSADCDGNVVKSLVKKLGDFSTSSPYLYLLPNFMPEVNFRWPFYTTEEKELVRKIQQKAANVTVQPQDSSFAPTRRKGMEKMTASSRRNPTDSSSSAAPPKPAEKTPEKPAPPPVKIEEKDEEMDIPAPQGIKRKAHVPQASQGSQEKRARTEIVVNNKPLPPQQHQHNHHQNHNNSHILPPNLVQNHHNHQHQQNGGGSTASSRVSSPASSLSSPSQPSCDWEKEYGEIKTTHQAEQYFGIFQKDYPIYMECYKKLTYVSKEFRDLETKLRRGDKNVEIEKAIQTRYGDYEKDPEFMRVRQKHTDLRSKLAVLKNRIGNWKPSSSST
ncbi:unnamed protein product [Caenorhabditis angaria]|uniref:OCEL domain-containing protein n=1 Tax=Caenorhabditis angaria TaxID=860376 RepID=A0A9P1ILM7_9PELO|nr:unnamed protein product [Caenorhabditis angaria]